ncbi:putative Endonuclease/exonuclease/phosphatase protein [Trachipleistophora hominis]|uniref:Putative Endonuclease/exonuclease/phosphatase protein n=1 Tax=Trachipleistophora hominis TaxID=72359 RepID=L7JVP5_TRAHO|nr:putative Endonuclease/exonuclease/phosphatase protein [Trachipleistophora hominis]
MSRPAEDAASLHCQVQHPMTIKDRITRSKDGLTRIGVWKLEAFTTKTVKRLLGGQLDTELLVKRIRQSDGVRRHDVWLESAFYNAHARVVRNAVERVGGHMKVFENGRVRVPKPRVITTRGKPNSHLSAMTVNICGVMGKRADLCTVLDRKQPVIVALQETLLVREDYRLLLPGYATIESKMTAEDGSRGLALCIRKQSGLQLSEYKADPCFLAGTVEGLAEDNTTFSILMVCV